MSHFKSISKTVLGLSVAVACSTITPLTYADTYKGNRDTNNRFHGEGKYTYLNGGSYQGQWKHGQKSGKGKRIWSDGTVYEGQWSNNTPHGKGVKTFSDGSQYSGNFTNGERSGQGTMKWRNGDIYIGQWESALPHGQGTKQFANGASYTGEFAAGQQSGQGKYTYADRSHYQGNWDNNAPHGRGTLTLISGDKYIGNFALGQPEGFGEFFYANGDRYTGQWKNGKRMGKGSLKYGAGGSYDGYFEQGKKSGYGILVTALGDEYVGPFKNDMAHGKGTCKQHNQKNDCEYKFGQKITSTRLAAAGSPEPETPITSATPVSTVTAVISTAPVVAAKAQFKKTIEKDIKKLSTTYSLADIPQKTSDILFSHDFDIDLMSIPEKARWKKRSALFSDNVRIESKHGTVRIVIELANYRGPGVYKIDDDRVTVSQKNKKEYQASDIKPSTITIKSDNDAWISGTFDLVLFDDTHDKPAHQIKNGVFRLSKDSQLGYQSW